MEESLKAFDKIDEDRKNALKHLSHFIQDEARLHSIVNLNFICTHNSRRSQFAELAANIAAFYYGLNHIHSYSGGTEVTALHHNALKAMRRLGCEIEISSVIDDNPRNTIHFSNSTSSIQFSKLYYEALKTDERFIAVMTCGEADSNCPIVVGATSRISLTYDDPKSSDGTDMASLIYDQRLFQILTEILYSFSLLS